MFFYVTDAQMARKVMLKFRVIFSSVCDPSSLAFILRYIDVSTIALMMTDRGCHCDRRLSNVSGLSKLEQPLSTISVVDE